MIADLIKKKEEREKRQFKRSIIFIILGFGTIVFIACFAWFIALVNALAILSGFDGGCDSHDPSIFEEYAEVTLPTSFNNFDSFCGGLQGLVFEAQFDIHPDDLEGFLQTTSIDNASLTHELPTTVHSTKRNKLYEIESVRYGIYDSFEWREEIIIDIRDQERWVVYFTVLAG